MLETLLLSAVEDLLRGISGPLGIRLRRAYYRRRLKRCGARLVIETGVHILSPGFISLGDDVWLDRNVLLIAGPPAADERVELRPNPDIRAARGEIVIGDGAHVGIGSIIQGHGGVQIGAGFTAGPHVKIYSFSHDHRRCRAGTMRRAGVATFYLETPVFIGENVWLGINVTVVGHSIVSDCFAQPGAVITASMPANSIIAGAPAKVAGRRFAEQAEDASQA